MAAQLGTRLRSDLFAELNDALDVACEILAALDQYQRVGIDLYLFDQPRRWLIHTLLSLSFVHPVTEAYRLAFLLFVEMVIYPLPSCANVKPRLCKSLVTILEHINDHWRSESGLAWIFMMGGMCSKGSGGENLFAEYFVRYSMDRFQDWEALSSTMQECLWHPICHRVGYGFWQTCCLKMAYR
jgi:hypothetical protein